LSPADLESLFPPDPRHSLGVNLKTIPAKECGDPPVAVTGLLQAQLNDFFADTTALNALFGRTVVAGAGESKGTACQCRAAPNPFYANLNSPPLG